MEEVGGSAAARVTVVAPLPLLTAQLDTPDAAVVPPAQPPQQPQQRRRAFPRH